MLPIKVTLCEVRIGRNATAAAATVDSVNVNCRVFGDLCRCQNQSDRSLCAVVTLLHFERARVKEVEESISANYNHNSKIGLRRSESLLLLLGP